MKEISKMKKAMIIAPLTLGLLISSTNVTFAKSFKDVGMDNWNKNEISEISDRGIISGYDDGTFKPGNLVTRSQASKIIWKALESAKLDKTKKDIFKYKKFKDVKDNEWYSTYIYKMQTTGIIKGYDDGTFKPAANLTRSQVIKMLVEAFGVPKASISNPFTDVPSNRWDLPYVTAAYNAGILQKEFNSEFNGAKKVTREELVLYTARAIKWHENKKKSYETTVFKRKNYAVVPAGTKYPNSYKSMQQGLSKTEPVIKYDMKEVNYTQIADIMFNDFYYKNPTKYFIKSWTAVSDGTVKVTYSGSPQSVQNKLKIVDQRTEEILKKIIKPNYTEYDKVKAVHDYVVENTAYDYNNYLKGTIPDDSFNIYGTLVNKKAVCDGYARTVSYMLDKLGIENYFVTGSSKQDGSHAWNLVKIDGQYYYLDATWNDPVPDKAGRITYTYFLVDQDTLSKTHKWDKSSLPAANSKKYLNKK